MAANEAATIETLKAYRDIIARLWCADRHAQRKIQVGNKL
jgi:hypothetical protein